MSPINLKMLRLSMRIQRMVRLLATIQLFFFFLNCDPFSERDAFGTDEYHPLSHKGSNLTTAGGIGYTIADSLDTIILMQQQGYGLDAEYERARAWVKDTLSFDRDANFNTFEVRLGYRYMHAVIYLWTQTTIRVLGGLLSAHYLTSDELYLERAR